MPVMRLFVGHGDGHKSGRSGAGKGKKKGPIFAISDHRSEVRFGMNPCFRETYIDGKTATPEGAAVERPVHRTAFARRYSDLVAG